MSTTKITDEMASDNEEMPLTLPDTQKIDDLLLTQPQEVTSSQQMIWGRLFPNKSSLPLLVMSKDTYTLGRHKECDVVLGETELQSKRLLGGISKIHLKISREIIDGSPEDAIVYLQDLSYNGSFINKVLVGKERKVPLMDNDVISLAQSTFQAYTYLSSSNPETNRLPPELRAKYVVSRTLGTGVCGKVKLLLGIFNSKKFALKKIAKKNVLDLGVENSMVASKTVMNEVEIMRSLSHPCIVKMNEVVETPTAVFLVLEMMEGGELFDRINKSDGLSEDIAKFIFYQIVHAVDYLHRQGITHRDLKPQNILLASDAEYPLVKISDFGLSKFVDTESLMRTFCGTPMYVAPEILITSGRGTYTKQVDVWSLGVILYVSLSGRVPFSTRHLSIPLRDQIVKGMYRISSTYFRGVSQNAIDLIKRMMTTNPIKRITTGQIRQHPWLQDQEMEDTVTMLINSNEENSVPNKQENSIQSRSTCVFEELSPRPKRPRLQ